MDRLDLEPAVLVRALIAAWRATRGSTIVLATVVHDDTEGFHYPWSDLHGGFGPHPRLNAECVDGYEVILWIGRHWIDAPWPAHWFPAVKGPDRDARISRAFLENAWTTITHENGRITRPATEAEMVAMVMKSRRRLRL